MATQLKNPTELDFVPLSPAIGVEARGIDLCEPVDPDTQAALRAAWVVPLSLLVSPTDITS